MSSVVMVNTSQATHEPMSCTCKGVWDGKPPSGSPSKTCVRYHVECKLLQSFTKCLLFFCFCFSF
jgi:hypothetical protein